MIMVLFGNEFDADERAEVGGGDGLVKGKGSDLTAVGFLNRLGSRENQLPQIHPIVDRDSDDGDFVGAYHELMTANLLRELMKAQNCEVRAAEAEISSFQKLRLPELFPVGPPVDVATDDPLT